jgi:hypothetical protein
MFNRSAHIFFSAAALLFVVPIAGAQQSVRSSKLIQPNSFAPPQPAADCPVAAAAAIADIPDDVDLVLVVENGTDLRASPIGDAAARFLTESGVIVDLTKAWKSLGDQLGWSAQETFDRLLGRRVILLSRSVAQGNDRRWAILSDVAVDTEAQLKDKLQAAPRAIVQGHQILTLENGAYELTSHHHAAPGAAKQGKLAARRFASNERVTLVLGPAGKGELFDEMLSVLSRPAPAAGAMVAANNGPVGTMSSHEIFTLACQAGPTEVLLMAALDPAAATPSETGASAPSRAAIDRWKDFVLLAGHRDQDAAANLIDKREGATWRSRVVVRQTARREELLKIEPSSDAPFRALRKGALVAMVQNTPLPAVLGDWAPSFTNILSVVPIPEDAKRQMSARQALCVRALPPDNRVSCTVARHTGGTDQLARTLDPEVSAGVQRIEKQFGVVSPPPQDYAGLAPNAVRTTPLACSEQGGMSMFTSRPLTISWAYPSQVAVNGPGNLNDPAVKDPACAVLCANNPRPGWWVLNISQRAAPVAPAAPGVAAPKQNASPTPGELLRSDANALLSTDPQADTARWVWLASARPAALEALLPSVFPDYNGIRAGLRRFEWVDLKLQITEQGDVQGDLGLRLADQPAPPPK